MRTGFIVLFALFSLVGLLHSAAAIGAASPTVLDVTPSLISTFLAGRTANPNWPDGVGGGAYLDQPGWVTGCRGKLYFTDFRGIRSVDPLTGRVTTLIAASSSFRPLWCDGSFLYTSTTFNGGQLTIEQIDPDRLQTSTFSYPAIGSYTRGTVEFLMGIGDTLYTTDSASGRIWKIDLPTRNRTVIADFGGPLITQNPLGSSRPPVLISAGAFWTDGSDIYIVRPQPNAPSILARVRIDSGEVTTLFSGYFSGVWGWGSSLYLSAAGGIRKFDVVTSQMSPFSSQVNANISWSDADSLYFTISALEGAIGKMDPATAQMTLIAGDMLRDVDGFGTNARFAVYLLPASIRLHGDSQFLYILEPSSLRRFDLSTGFVSTVASGLGYLMEGFSLRRYDPEPSIRTFAAPAQGLQVIDMVPAPSLTVLHSEIRFSNGTEVSAGTAIWAYRNPDGVLVSEAAVAAQRPIRAGRIYAEVQGPVNTGIAIANTNDEEVRVDFYFTDVDGVEAGGGSVLLRPREQLARFLNEAPFSGGNSIQGAFTFIASAPVAAVAIRGRTNERSEFLMTTLPVADLDAMVSRDTRTIAHFATGGGWRTEVLLVNPTDEVLSGTARFIGDDGRTIQSYSYRISPRSSRRLVAESASASIEKGSVSITPLSSTATPVPLVIFGFAPAGTTITETGVPATEGTELAVYVESTGPLNDEVDSGLAIANTTDENIRVFLRLATTAGMPFGQSAILSLAPRAQASMFLPQLFPTLQLPFTGVLHISSAANISLTALRGRYNARREFIVATVTPMVKGPRSAELPLYLPHMITGGGYTTRLILINPTGSWSTGNIRLLKTDGSPAR